MKGGIRDMVGEIVAFVIAQPNCTIMGLSAPSMGLRPSHGVLLLPTLGGSSACSSGNWQFLEGLILFFCLAIGLWFSPN